MTSRAYLTFVGGGRDGPRLASPPQRHETDDEKRRAAEAEQRRAERLKARRALEAR
jgi:hypothetical protein